jgi:hypothetical protein
MPEWCFALGLTLLYAVVIGFALLADWFDRRLPGGRDDR